MTMQENARLILGLRSKGWTDTEIAGFLLWIESGEEQYKPEQQEKARLPSGKLLLQMQKYSLTNDFCKCRI